MNASAQPLIRLNGIEKVFDTDEVDTHYYSKELLMSDQARESFVMPDLVR